MIKKILFVCFIILLSASQVHAQTPLTRQEFCQILIEQMRAYGTLAPFGSDQRPFTDTVDPFVLQAHALGLISGNGTGLFYPDQEINREQAIFILKKAQDYICPRLIYDTAKKKDLLDISLISGYAAPSAVLLTMTNTLPSGLFSPKNPVMKNDALQMIDNVYQTTKMPAAKPGYLPQKKVPVLMYHLIGNPGDEKDPYGYLFVRPVEFEQQIKYLSQHGYTFLFPDELSYAEQCSKPILITFDDGHKDNFDVAFSIIQKYHAKATIFVTTNNIDQPYMMNKSQIKILSDSGLVKIGSHCVSHNPLPQMKENELIQELEVSQRILENIIGKKITTISYPHGEYSSQVLAQTKRYYTSAFSVLQGEQGNPYAIKRIPIDRGCSMEQFKKLIQ